MVSARVAAPLYTVRSTEHSIGKITSETDSPGFCPELNILIHTFSLCELESNEARDKSSGFDGCLICQSFLFGEHAYGFGGCLSESNPARGKVVFSIEPFAFNQLGGGYDNFIGIS